MDKIQSIDMKNLAIIKAFPTYNIKKTVLNIGCGDGRIDYYLAKMGYRVYAIDIIKNNNWKNNHRLNFYIADIFDLSSLPVYSAPIVICSQVLEHLRNYKKALVNLLELTEKRLIITVPYKKSFSHPEHVNFWDDRNIVEFKKLCKPYPTSISKIITKLEDEITGQRDYLIIVDKGGGK